MGEPIEAESILPYSPSHTGRRSNVGYLGFTGVGFNDLWPLAAGVIASLVLAIALFLGGDWAEGSWQGKTCVAALPAALGFGYLRGLVVGRPPHFKGDLWIAVRALRLDFIDPPWAGLPVWPRVWADLAATGGPERARDERTPLARRREAARR
jgi:hypothetical protein